MALAGQARVAAWVAGLAFSRRVGPRMRLEGRPVGGEGLGGRCPSSRRLSSESTAGPYATPGGGQIRAKSGRGAGSGFHFMEAPVGQKACSCSLIAGAAGAVVTSGGGEAETAWLWPGRPGQQAAVRLPESPRPSGALGASRCLGGPEFCLAPQAPGPTRAPAGPSRPPATPPRPPRPPPPHPPAPQRICQFQQGTLGPVT